VAQVAHEAVAVVVAVLVTKILWFLAQAVLVVLAI
jgi:hypothetical protein